MTGLHIYLRLPRKRRQRCQAQQSGYQRQCGFEFLNECESVDIHSWGQVIFRSIFVKSAISRFKIDFLPSAVTLWRWNVDRKCSPVDAYRTRGRRSSIYCGRSGSEIVNIDRAIFRVSPVAEYDFYRNLSLFVRPSTSIRLQFWDGLGLFKALSIRSH